MADYGITRYPDSNSLLVHQPFCNVFFKVWQIGYREKELWTVGSYDVDGYLFGIATFDTLEDAKKFQEALAKFVNDYGDNNKTTTKKFLARDKNGRKVFVGDTVMRRVRWLCGVANEVEQMQEYFRATPDCIDAILSGELTLVVNAKEG